MIVRLESKRKHPVTEDLLGYYIIEISLFISFTAVIVTILILSWSITGGASLALLTDGSKDEDTYDPSALAVATIIVIYIYTTKNIFQSDNFLI